MLADGGGRKQVCSGPGRVQCWGCSAGPLRRTCPLPAARRASAPARQPHACCSARPAARPHAQAIALRSPGSQGLGSVDDPADAPLLAADDFENTRARALEAVEVPPLVLQLIADLRSYLQVGAEGRQRALRRALRACCTRARSLLHCLGTCPLASLTPDPSCNCHRTLHCRRTSASRRCTCRTAAW